MKTKSLITHITTLTPLSQPTHWPRSIHKYILPPTPPTSKCPNLIHLWSWIRHFLRLSFSCSVSWLSISCFPQPCSTSNERLWYFFNWFFFLSAYDTKCHCQNLIYAELQIANESFYITKLNNTFLYSDNRLFIHTLFSKFFFCPEQI